MCFGEEELEVWTRHLCSAIVYKLQEGPVERLVHYAMVPFSDYDTVFVIFWDHLTRAMFDIRTMSKSMYGAKRQTGLKRMQNNDHPAECANLHLIVKNATSVHL